MQMATMSEMNPLNRLIGRLDVERSGRPDGNAAGMCTGLFAGGNDGPHDIAGFKAMHRLGGFGRGAVKA
jgi:hypothetical protein